MRSWYCLLLFVAAASYTAAQNTFIAFEKGEARRITQVRSNTAWSERDGKPVSEKGSTLILAKGRVYLPGFVKLSQVEVTTTHLEDQNGGRFNYDMRVRGRAESDTAFAKCFMVLDLSLWRSNGFVYAALPDLPAGKPVDFDVSFQLVDQVEQGSYSLHLFSEGNEVLHSQMSPSYVAAQKKKTETLLAGKQRDYGAIVARAERAPYPAKAGGISGTARVRFTVTKLGTVAAPELLSASHPAFGEAALAAIVKWKFDPALKDLRLAETTMEMPFTFTPPGAKGGTKAKEKGAK